MSPPREFDPAEAVGRNPGGVRGADDADDPAGSPADRIEQRQALDGSDVDGDVEELASQDGETDLPLDVATEGDAVGQRQTVVLDEEDAAR